MIFYQVLIAVIAIGTLTRCETTNGVLAGLVIWFLLGVFPLIMVHKGKKLTKTEIRRQNQYYEYQEEYFNNFGELP